MAKLQDMSRKELQDHLQKRYKDQNNKIKENYDRLSATLPKGTKERIQALGFSINGFLNDVILRELDKLEKQDKQLEKMIYQDILMEAESIDNDLIAAGLPDIEPAKKAEIKAKLDKQIAEAEAKKAEKQKQEPRKDSFFEKLDQLKKDNNEGKLALNVRDDS